MFANNFAFSTKHSTFFKRKHKYEKCKEIVKVKKKKRQRQR